VDQFMAVHCHIMSQASNPGFPFQFFSKAARKNSLGLRLWWHYMGNSSTVVEQEHIGKVQLIWAIMAVCIRSLLKNHA